MGVMILCGLFGTVFSYETPGIRLELLLKDWSKLTHEEFHCPQFLKNEVIASSFENQSIEVVKAQLAQVVHGTWSQKEDGWWLSQSGIQQRDERKWNIDLHRAAYDYRLKQLAAYAPKTEWTNAEAENLVIKLKNRRAKGRESALSEQETERLQMSKPDNRLVARIASLLKPDMFPLDGLERDGRRLSPTPLATHIRIPISIHGPMNQFQTEYQLYEQVLGRNEDEWRGAVNMEIRTYSFERPEFNLYLYDQNWRYVTSCWASLEVSNDAFMAKAESFPLSKETQAMIAFAGQLSDDRYDRSKDAEYKRNPLYKKAMNVMFHATKTDPLGLLQGPCWIDFAKSQNKPLLVNLEEDVYGGRPRTFVPTLDQSPLATGMQRLDSDGWVLARPKNPLFNRTWRLDRSVVETFSRLIASPDVGTIDSQIRLDDLGRYSWTFGMGVPNEQFLVGYDSIGNGPFCLLGTLSTDQLRRCKQGEALPTSRLPERAQVYLADLMANGNLDNLSPRIKESEASTPAYCFPNGLPEMQLTAKEEDVDLLSLTTDEGVPGRTAMNLVYEVRQALAKDPGMSGQTFSVWKAKQLTAELRFGDRKLTQSTTELGRHDVKTYTWQTLPDSIKTPLLQAMKRAGQ